MLEVATLILDNKDKLSNLIQKLQDAEEWLLRASQDDRKAKNDLDETRSRVCRVQSDLHRLGDELEHHSHMFHDLSQKMKALL